MINITNYHFRANLNKAYQKQQYLRQFNCQPLRKEPVFKAQPIRTKIDKKA